jgi:hypothetical protein
MTAWQYVKGQYQANPAYLLDFFQKFAQIKEGEALPTATPSER